ncbi:MAG: dockerin type I repeat-containing protein, partial [Oscillospiraceae bacterium]|nr:dockerin type I repeat-containing protein [Oscillospiraceae bacterium]
IRRNDGSLFVVRMPDESIPSWAPTNFERASNFPLYEAVGGKFVLCIPYTVSDDFDYVLDDPGMAGGSANHKLLSVERYTDGNRGYLVEVYNVLSEGNFGMKWLRVPKEGKSVTQERLYTLSFDVSETLLAHESALDSLFPADYDSASKAEPIVVKNGFLICTGYGSGSTGFKTIVEIDGSAIADPVTSRYNSVEYTPTSLDGGRPSGGTTYESFAYKPVQEGILKVKVVSGRTFNRSEDSVLGTKYFKVNADLSLTEITVTKGDLDGDGKTTTADLVALSKYLSGAGTLSEKQFYAADMRDDSRINAADLSAMKQKLLSAKA